MAEAAVTRTVPLIVAAKRLTAARFFPVPHRFTLGLHPIREVEWLHTPTAPEMRRKRELLDGADRPSMLDAVPSSEAAQAELLELVQAHAARHFGDASDAGEPSGGLPIERAGRLVAEDLLLMERRHTGGSTREHQWHLTAGCLCFPSRWALADKLGRPMREIHSPVPGLNERIGAKIEHFFDRLTPGALVCRMNSAIMDDPELHQPPSFAAARAHPPPGAADEQASAAGGERLLLRMERQTLRRLPLSGAVVFTIQTLQMRLPDVAKDAELAAAVAGHCKPLAGGSNPPLADERWMPGS